MPCRRHRRAARAVALALVVIGGAAGCASAVAVEPATHATDPECASLVLATPDNLGDGLDRRRTTAQASTAWGDPAVVLRCGVEPPGPTTERCETVATPGGPSVDWLVIPGDGALPSDGSTPSAGPTAGADTDWTLVTYGRVPAVEVFVPSAVAAARSTSFLDQLGPAIAAHTEQLRSCL